ncbi:Probable transposase [Moraxella lacunata]|uniref:Probable transposase n=1 Tax=Moraxella lacunata TaxID=477 RepID=A0A378QMM5_MORLA|nr:RNA-guided endonuclease TnpB family protein [Moraxella lacunata]STZ01554.1 Probable transposase [Moraxella lacunata]
MLSPTCHYATRDAFKRFFKGESGYPTFRKKGVNDRFSLSNDQFKLKLKKDKPFIQIPNLDLLKCVKTYALMAKSSVPKSLPKVVNGFVSIAVELDNNTQVRQLKTNQTLKTLKTGNAVGIDLGITDLATLSTGEKIQAPKPLKNKLKKLQRLSKQLSRKQKGSNNREKAKTKLSRLHYQISCIRKDFYTNLVPTWLKSLM